MNGELKTAATRGDGLVGEDVTDNVMSMIECHSFNLKGNNKAPLNFLIIVFWKLGAKLFLKSFESFNKHQEKSSEKLLLMLEMLLLAVCDS